MDFEYLVQEVYPEKIPSHLADLYEYWLGKSCNELGPSWDNFRLDEIKPQFLPWITIVDVIPGEPLDFKYRFWGSSRTTLQGYDKTGQTTSSLTPKTVSEKVTAEYVAVCEVKKPVHVITSSAKGASREFRYDSIRLPLSTDGNSVDKILSLNILGIEEIPMYRLFGTTPPI